VVVVLCLREDLLVHEPADHLEDRLLLVGLFIERCRYGHGGEHTRGLATLRQSAAVAELADSRYQQPGELSDQAGREEPVPLLLPDACTHEALVAEQP
jgi:hypothetical protein